MVIEIKDKHYELEVFFLDKLGQDACKLFE